MTNPNYEKMWAQAFVIYALDFLSSFVIRASSFLNFPSGND